MLECGWRCDQAAFCAGVLVTSTPFRNVTPWTTLGNWFSPFSLRHVLAAAMTSLNTMSRAVSWDNAPLVRTVSVPHRGEHALDRVGRAQVIPVLGREVVEGQQRVSVLDQAGGRL